MKCWMLVLPTCLALSAHPLFAWQEEAQGKVVTPAENEAVHNEIRALRDRLVTAINAGDLDQVVSSCTENITLTTPDAAVSRGRDGIRAYYDSKMKCDPRVVESFSCKPTVDELTVLYDGDTGVATGTSVDHFKMANGMEFDMHNRWSATLVKQDGNWLLSNYHTATDVFDNPLLSAAKTALYWAAGIALLVGGVGGTLVGWMIGKRRARAV